MKDVNAVLLPLTLLGVLAVFVAMPRERRRDRLVVVGVALLVRVLFAAVVFVFLTVTDRPGLFLDEGNYLGLAQRVQEGADPTIFGFANLLGAVFEVTGPNEWSIRAANVILGAGLAVVVYEIVHLLLGREPALFAGTATALWPSLILWSPLVLKDPLTLLALAIFFLGTLHAFRGEWWGVITATPAVALVQWMRPYAFVLVSLALIVALLVRLFMTSVRLRLPAIALVLSVGLVGLVGGEGFLGISFVRAFFTGEAIQQAQAGSAHGDTAIGGSETGAESGSGSGSGSGSSIFSVLIGPFPWEAGPTTAAVFLTAELAYWYVVLALALASLWRIGIRRLLEEWMPLLAFAAGVMLVLLIYERNAGTALRQRAMIFPIACALAGLSYPKLGAASSVAKRLLRMDSVTP